MYICTSFWEKGKEMAVTRLVRKAKVNKARANNLTKKLKMDNIKPVIKKVDVEGLKAQFK